MLWGMESRAQVFNANGESSEGGRSQRNQFFVTLKVSEHLKENKALRSDSETVDFMKQLPNRRNE